jgi:hypothetical protein
MYSAIALALLVSALLLAIGWYSLGYLWLGGLCLTCGGGVIAALGAAWTRTIDCCSAQDGRTTGGKRCPECGFVNPIRIWSA